MLGTGHDLIYLDPPFNLNATYSVGSPEETGRDRMRGRTAACSQKRSVQHGGAHRSQHCGPLIFLSR